jgi:hypothetical protein
VRHAWWRVCVGIWLLVGVLALPLLYGVWHSSPSDDVDFNRMAWVFFIALLGWSATGTVLLLTWLLRRSAETEAALEEVS